MNNIINSNIKIKKYNNIDKMSKNCIKYPRNFTPCELDKILIPTNIKNMPYNKQCNYLLSPKAVHLRTKAKELYISMIKAYKNTSRGSCANPFYVSWNSCKGQFNISGKSLSSYYCHYLGSNKGYSGLLRKIIEYCERKAYVCQLIKEGKYCRPGNN